MCTSELVIYFYFFTAQNYFHLLHTCRQAIVKNTVSGTLVIVINKKAHIYNFVHISYICHWELKGKSNKRGRSIVVLKKEEPFRF